MRVAAPQNRLNPKTASLTRQFFDSPAPAGRKITAGFTYLQRISKAATLDVWFPEELRQEMDMRSREGKTIGAAQFPAQWAAVRQFELLQESGNHKIYDLDASQMKRATIDLVRGMRAGGYRVTVATLGTYHDDSAGDELEILDTTLQTRISQMISMLYLEAQSEEINIKADRKLAASTWDFRDQLPHVGMVLGAKDLYRRIAINDEDENKKRVGKKSASAMMSGSDRTHLKARQFFDILKLLPQKHIVNDTAIGLQLPELRGINQWNYVAAPDETLAAFNHVLGNIFNNCVTHLRGYGDRLTEDSDNFYRSAAMSFG